MTYKVCSLLDSHLVTAFFKTNQSVKKITRGYNWCSLCRRIKHECKILSLCKQQTFQPFNQNKTFKKPTDFRTIKPEEQKLFPDFRTHSCSTLYDLRSKDSGRKSHTVIKILISWNYFWHGHFLSLLNVRTFFFEVLFFTKHARVVFSCTVYLQPETMVGGSWIRVMRIMKPHSFLWAGLT